ncbi:MAG: hypothetical protein CSA60_04500 [Neptuniibacter caesariensis]|uniref:GTP-binding protein n=1 Tax=Neptuniibacter caesariensis TaxID=207954 RepID=A0A2G6JIX5_NEPCE|nr:MAG: hypothetical protein CSA60_04500 [Neptuniibacter caesariensis]
MKDYKILFTGSVCSGKSTAIRSLSDIDTLDTDAQASDVTVRRKKNTTIAMDYGVLELNNEARVHLYGTPGQERFRFMWDMLANEFAHDAIGMVILIDNTRKDTFRDIRFYLESFRQYLKKRRLVIAVTHTDVEPSPSVQEYYSFAQEIGLLTTVIAVDARDPRAVLSIVEELIAPVEHAVDWEQICERILDNNGFTLDFYKPIYEESLLDAAMNKRGITGAMHLGSDQEVLRSNIEAKSSNVILQNISKLAALVTRKADFMGTVNNVVLAGPKVQTLSIFTDQDQALCLCSDNGISLPVLKQQASDLLQWSQENEHLV